MALRLATAIAGPASASHQCARIYHIPVFKPAEDGIEPWLNLGNAAQLLKIAPKTLRLAAEAGEIDAIHPLSEGPWIFARAALGIIRTINHRTRAAKSKIPHGIASRSAKSLPFNHIDRWVF